MKKSEMLYNAGAAWLVLAAALILSGCATAVDRTEVEQRSNPVKAMHEELSGGQETDENALQVYGYEDALIKGRDEGKIIMVDFYTTWCKWCKKLDTDTYTDPKVIEALNKDFVVAKVDAESSKMVVSEMRQVTMAELAQSYQVTSFPALWFLDKDGGQMKLLNGYLPPDEFLKYLEYIKGGMYKGMSFDDYTSPGGAK